METALVVPVVVVLLLGMLQVAVVGRDQLALELAAREGARAAAVSATPEAAASAAARRTTTLDPLSVGVTASAGTVTVVVDYEQPTDVPIIGGLLPPVELSARATMTLEPP